MIYLKVKWKHRQEIYPTLLYSELDEGRWEVRKVEVFINGAMTYADERESTGNTVLGELPVPSVDEIAANPEFVPFLISKEEFDAIWDKARAIQRPNGNS